MRALHSCHADITETFYRTYDALTYGFFWDTEIFYIFTNEYQPKG